MDDQSQERDPGVQAIGSGRSTMDRSQTSQSRSRAATFFSRLMRPSHANQNNEDSSDPTIDLPEVERRKQDESHKKTSPRIRITKTFMRQEVENDLQGLNDDEEKEPRKDARKSQE